jgi:hypothetical protein
MVIDILSIYQHTVNTTVNRRNTKRVTNKLNNLYWLNVDGSGAFAWLPAEKMRFDNGGDDAMLTRCRKHKFRYQTVCPMCWADAEREKNGPAKAADQLNAPDKMVCKRHTRRHEPSCRYCNAEIEAEKAAQKKTTIKENCRGCVWLKDNGKGAPGFCAALSCVKRLGWVAEVLHF